MKMRLAGLVRVYRLAHHINPQACRVLIMANCLLGLLSTAQLHALRRLLEGFQLPDAGVMAGFWLAGLLLVFLASNLLSSVRGPVADEFQETVRHYIEEQCHRKVQRLSLTQLQDATLYDLLRRARQGAEQRVINALGFIWSTASLSIALITLLFYLGSIHPALPLLLAVGSTPGIILRAKHLTQRYLLHRTQTADERRFASISHLLVDRQAAAEVRLYGIAPWLMKQASMLLRQLRRQRLQHERKQAGVILWASACNAATYAATMAFAIQLMMDRQILLATCVALFYTVETFQANYNSLAWNIAVVYDDLLYLQDFFTFLAIPEPVAASELAMTGPVTSSVEWRDVSFAYPGNDSPVLTEINLVIHPGERIALVGENGAGKSTLAMLLMGLYQPTSGEIVVDGRGLRNLNLADWHKRIGTVFQDFTRYQTSVRDNIGFGHTENSGDTAAITAAAQRSGAMEFIKTLPHGLDTLLGRNFHNGVELSTGQWQKLAIARAYFRPAEILILDEPASGLDAKAEAAVYEHFAHMAAGKTVVLISHRLGSARLADRIVVLQAGRIVEEGSHRQLLTADGEYASMYRAQAEWYG